MRRAQAHRLQARSSPERSLTGRCSFGADGQLGAVIGDEDGEQARGLRRAGVLTDEMLAARRLEEGLASLVDSGRPGRRVLSPDST